MFKTLVSFGALSLAVCAFSAPITISQGGASFGWADDATLRGAAVRTGTSGGSGNILRSGGQATNHSFQQWWWYRANGVNTREFALSSESLAPIVGSNFVELNYREAEGFTARLEYTVTESSPNAALVTATARVRNEGNNALDLSFFQYVDFDVNATGGLDSAVMDSPNPAFRTTLTDGASPTILSWRGIDADNYHVAPFGSLRTSLGDAVITDLNNTGLPFGAGDFTGGLQWNFFLNPGEQIMLQTSFEVNAIPEPATMLGLGAAVSALVARRRRKSA